MEEREMPQKHSEESKTIEIMMTIVRPVTSRAGRTKFQVA
jgi:hypothetical protein